MKVGRGIFQVEFPIDAQVGGGRPWGEARWEKKKRSVATGTSRPFE